MVYYRTELHSFLTLSLPEPEALNRSHPDLGSKTTWPLYVKCRRAQ